MIIRYNVIVLPFYFTSFFLFFFFFFFFFHLISGKQPSGALFEFKSELESMKLVKARYVVPSWQKILDDWEVPPEAVHGIDCLK